MYRWFRIKNFRGFDEIELGPLDRVNLITGRNSVGKTALLEAIFLHLGSHNPALGNVVNQLRGLPLSISDPTESWGWLFHGKRTSTTIQVESRDEGGTQRSLAIQLAEDMANKVAPIGSQGAIGAKVLDSATTALGPRELLLTYTDPAGVNFVAQMALVGDEIKVRAPLKVSLPTGMFLTSAHRVQNDDLVRFLKLADQAVERESL